ncbi:hypothetical protein I6F15_01335 [Bradyrhizobium sp. BRP14]|nr:hypothetical protein [Bradyrhizobium sp. BRP14]
MRIYSASLRQESEVFGVAVSFNEFLPLGKRVVFYVNADDSLGLFVEELAGARILDNSLGKNFKMHLFSGGDGFMLLWDHFRDIDHLSRLMDFDNETVEAFEKARTSGPAF